MDRDGTRDGFDLALTRAVVDAVDIPVVASGGVGELQHLVDGAVEGGADAVLAVFIFHRREFTIGEAKAYMDVPRGDRPARPRRPASRAADLGMRIRAVPCSGGHVDDEERVRPRQGRRARW